MPILLARRTAVLLSALVLALAGPCAAAARDTLVIGSISRNIKEEIQTFRPLADYLAPRLGAAGIAGTKIAVVTSADEMARRLQRGEIDLYIDSPFIVAEIARRTGARPFLRRWKRGYAEYQSLFVTRRDSGVRTMDDLRGRVIAFDEPFSTSGHLLPKAMLLALGYRVIEVHDAEDRVPPDTIGYVFSMDDVNTMFWVDRGKVVAGVTSPDSFETFNKKHQGKYVVFERSMHIPRQVVAHRAGLDPELVAVLEQVLIGMEADGVGRAALRAFQKTTRFDRFPAGVEATFAPIYALLDFLGREPQRTQ